MQEYLNQLHRFSLTNTDLNLKKYRFFVLQIEELSRIIEELNSSWGHWITSFDQENTELFAEIEDIHLIWLEIHNSIRTNQQNIKKTNHDYY